MFFFFKNNRKIFEAGKSAKTAVHGNKSQRKKNVVRTWMAGPRPWFCRTTGLNHVDQLAGLAQGWTKPMVLGPGQTGPEDPWSNMVLRTTWSNMVQHGPRVFTWTRNHFFSSFL